MNEFHVKIIKFVFMLQPTDTHPGAHKDFAKKRLQLGESLYFKVLESVLVAEKKRHHKDTKIDLTVSTVYAVRVE